MGFVKDFLERRKVREIKVREFETNDKIVSDIERRKLSHNEREMIEILRKEKEQSLKEALRFEEQRRKADELYRERSMFMNGGFNLLE